MKNKETLAEYSERMSKVEKKEELVIGRASAGNSRAIFHFDNQVYFLESFGYSTYSQGGISDIAKTFRMAFVEPHDRWVSTYMSYGKTRATKIAKHYHARIEEAPYAEEDNKWFYYVFDTFEDMIKFSYDRYTGAFEKLWGTEKRAFICCFGDQTPEPVYADRDIS